MELWMTLEKLRKKSEFNESLTTDEIALFCCEIKRFSKNSPISIPLPIAHPYENKTVDWPWIFSSFLSDDYCFASYRCHSAPMFPIYFLNLLYFSTLPLFISYIFKLHPPTLHLLLLLFLFQLLLDNHSLISPIFDKIITYLCKRIEI